MFAFVVHCAGNVHPLPLVEHQLPVENPRRCSSILLPLSYLKYKKAQLHEKLGRFLPELARFARTVSAGALLSCMKSSDGFRRS